MKDIKGIPYSTAEFDKDGNPLARPTVPAGTTDLIVISHGWNNNRSEAEALYRKLFENFAKVTAADDEIQRRKIAIVGVIWPSKKFDELMSTAPTASKAAGGAASADGAADQVASEEAMQAAINRAAPLFDDDGDDERLATLRALVTGLGDDTAAQQDFVETLRALLDPDGSKAREETEEDNAEIFFRGPAGAVFKNATQAPDDDTSADSAEAEAGAGHAAGIRSFLSDAANAVVNLLNLTTYFEMKQRAGTVGKTGLAPLIDQLADQVERVHLVGHSFGGRVVTAAAANSTTPKLHSLSLLQAAFSHNGFSKKRSGFFRSVVDNQRIHGPILVTHTKNDKAVGLAYPAASRINRDNATGFGDADDEFGGLGSNGAQQMQDGEVSANITNVLSIKQPYTWQPGKIHNLKSDQFIVDPRGGDAHGFVFVPEVAWAISRAILS